MFCSSIFYGTKKIIGQQMLITKQFVICHSALDKNEYNHITATYFLLAERRLKIARQEEMQSERSNVAPKNGRISPKKPSRDVVDCASELLSSNLLAPPPIGYNSRTGADGTASTVSKIRIFQSIFNLMNQIMICFVLLKKDLELEEEKMAIKFYLYITRMISE